MTLLWAVTWRTVSLCPFYWALHRWRKCEMSQGWGVRTTVVVPTHPAPFVAAQGLREGRGDCLPLKPGGPAIYLLCVRAGTNGIVAALPALVCWLRTAIEEGGRVTGTASSALLIGMGGRCGG